MTHNAQLTYEFALPDRDARMKELILYISDKCSNNPKYGATMLNKILWAIDFISFQNRGKPIMGEKYQRLEHGPAPYRLRPIRQEMEDAGDLHVRATNYHGRTQHRIIALRNANLSIFDGDEIALVDDIIRTLGEYTGTELSEWSHQRAWKTRRDGDLMPYESCFLSNEPVTQGDISRTEELARQFKWHGCDTQTRGC